MRSFVLVFLFALACGDDSSPVDAGTDVPMPDVGIDSFVEPDVPIPTCGTAGGSIASAAEALEYFDEGTMTDLEALDLSVTILGVDRSLTDEVVFEQARFALQRPARIHGWSVRWVLPEGMAPDAELETGLYRDFGHNGFDMWLPDPLFVGTRCVRDVSGGWVDYVLPTPVEVANPGLVYVGSRHEGAGTPRIAMDTTFDHPEGDCAAFADCRGSWNMPNVERRQFFHGVTLPHPYDYAIRLWVEYTDAIADEERVFQPVADVAFGTHVAWGDYDHDGWDDVVTDGIRLMRNVDGAFEDVTAAAGLAGISGSGVWGDYDNDGCLDLFVFSGGYADTDRLLRNQCDGTFVDVNSAAGITDTQSYEDCGVAGAMGSPSPAAAWLDWDADGFLDVYVANFICWERETYYVDRAFHNEGDGTFTDVSESMGFSAERQASRGVAPIDHDRDGDVDLMVNTYRLQRNLFFDNEGGAFTERGEALGLSGIPNERLGGITYYGHTIGTAWGDLDGDGDFDAVHANLAHPRFYGFSDKSQVLMQQSDGTYVDAAGDWALPEGANGLRFQETHSTPIVADFDQDGHLDLVIPCVYDGRPTDYYHGNGDGTFRLDTFTTGITATDVLAGSAGDFDRDGDIDVIVRELFENTRTTGHFVQVRVVGDVSTNRAGIGAVVSVSAGGVTRIRHVQGGTGQGGQDSLYLHFGLGDATTIDSIRVELPGGSSVDYAGPFDADQRIWIMESGSTHLGWEPP